METTNHEYYVSLEVAKLLKEAGFDWLTRYSYDLYLYNTEGEKRVIDGFATIFCNEHNGLASMPTLDVAQRWLREVKEYHIILSHRTEMFFEEKRYNLNEIKADIINKYPGGGLYITSTVFYRTYEEAQEDGIKKALELILKKGE